MSTLAAIRLAVPSVFSIVDIVGAKNCVPPAFEKIQRYFSNNGI